MTCPLDHGEPVMQADLKVAGRSAEQWAGVWGVGDVAVRDATGYDGQAATRICNALVVWYVLRWCFPQSSRGRTSREGTVGWWHVRVNNGCGRLRLEPAPL